MLWLLENEVELDPPMLGNSGDPPFSMMLLVFDVLSSTPQIVSKSEMVFRQEGERRRKNKQGYRVF